VRTPAQSTVSAKALAEVEAGASLVQLLVARRPRRPHANGAPGDWWCDYRLVGTLPDGKWRMECQYLHDEDSEYCNGVDSHTGLWCAYYSEPTAAKALLALAGDSGFDKSMSLHPVHKLALQARDLEHQVYSAQAKLSDKAKAARRETVQTAAQGEYIRLLKKRRIHSKAMQGLAPEAMVEVCKTTARAFRDQLLVELAAQEQEYERVLHELEAEFRMASARLDSTCDALLGVAKE